jgi:hypothetical protein
MNVIWVGIVVLVTVDQANAMLIKTSGDQMVLGGPVLDGDAPKIADALAKNPQVTTVILRNSPGGDVLTGYQVGEMIREKGYGLRFPAIVFPRARACSSAVVPGFSRMIILWQIPMLGFMVTTTITDF